MIPSAQYYLFIPMKDLLLYRTNFILIIFSTLYLLMITLSFLLIQNGSLLSNWSKDNTCGFALIKLVNNILILILLHSIYHLQLLSLLISKFLLILLLRLLFLFLVQYYLQPPLLLCLIWVLCFGGYLVPTVESGLQPDINMKSFTIQLLILHYPIKMRFLSVI